MKTRILFVTGTDTNAGKTVVAAALTRYLCSLGQSVMALKPLCSGGREDAVALHEAMGGDASLDLVNPWHFKAALSPATAAGKERKRVFKKEVLAHIRQFAGKYQWLIVEGAGGLLSPMGADFNARDLIAALRCEVIVVCPNRLGAINQTLLVLNALPQGASRRARVALVSQSAPDSSAPSNIRTLREMLGSGRVVSFPWLGKKQAGLRKALEGLAAVGVGQGGGQLGTRLKTLKVMGLRTRSSTGLA